MAQATVAVFADAEEAALAARGPGASMRVMSALVVDWTTPPLLEGDLLTADEFLRRWEEMPDVRRAELIDGTVYMPSPVSCEHSQCQMLLTVWLGNYALATPGSMPSPEATWIMGGKQVPQPDSTLLILPEYGGQARKQGSYWAGPPELILEVAVSSYARDFGVKKRLYERSGVREYVIVNVREEQVIAFSLTAEGYRPMSAGKDGIFRSVVFPGLWLDTAALWTRDLQRVNAVLQQGIATPEHAAFVVELAGRKK